MAMDVRSRGGKRPGAGRPPTTDPLRRIQMTEYAKITLARFALINRQQGKVFDQGTLASGILEHVIPRLLNK